MKKIDWYDVFEYIKILAGVIIVATWVVGMWLLAVHIGYQQGQKDAEKIIIHVADNAGAEMVGKITDKEIIEGKFTVTAGAYGKFLVTKEQYDALNVGDDIPDYLKGRGNQ